MRHINGKIFLFFLIFSGYVESALALKSDKQKPINIAAASLQVDEGLGEATYLGGVVMTQGSVRLTSTSLTATNDPKTEGQVLIAKGNPVTFIQQLDKNKGTVRAEALQMEYYTKTNQVILLHNAKVWQGKDSFESEKIIYDRKKGTLQAGNTTGGTPQAGNTPRKTGVTATIYPDLQDPAAKKKAPEPPQEHTEP